MRRLMGALQFLTVLPIRAGTASPGRSAVFFPLVGALLGLAASLVLRYSSPIIALAFLIVTTGCLHEDGLADVADAFRAGRAREKILAILKDSRIGTYGTVALMITLLMRWQSIAQLTIDPWRGLPGALALSRGSMVALSACTPSAAEGLGRLFRADLSRFTLVAVIVQASAVALFAGWQRGAAMILATVLLTLFARWYFMRHLGGITGDCMGAACQIVEAANLAILAWRPSF